jgi:hypothetical protein
MSNHHLNPLRAGLVKDIEALKRYPYSGHSALMGKRVGVLRAFTPGAYSVIGPASSWD